MQQVLMSLLLMVTISSCSVVKMKYNRDKILDRYTNGYKIYLDSTLIDLENYYLDSDNIKSIIRDKTKHAIYIQRDSIVKFYDLKEFFQNAKSERLFIFNGVPIETERVMNMKVSPKAIIELTLLRNDTLNSVFSCRTNKEVLLFSVKQ